MNKNKFRFWNPQAQKFITNYNYNGAVDELFKQDDYIRPQQFIGILDKNLKEIYEGDVVTYYSYFNRVIGEVIYSYDICAYCIDYKPIYEFDFNTDSLEVIGNMVEDYFYNEDGELALKKQNE